MSNALRNTSASLDGRTVFVTGASGGLGREFVRQALARGARKVYAAARTPDEWNEARVQPIRLDVAITDDVARAAAASPDVEILINNAATAPASDSIVGPEEELRRIFETNFFGALRVANAYAPVLATNGGGILLNVLSSAVWISMPTGYAASKAALWSATNALRFQLEGQGTHVAALVVGMIDTKMSARFQVPKSNPADIVARTYDGISAGLLEILADEQTRDLKTRLSQAAEEFYPWLHARLRAFLAAA